MWSAPSDLPDDLTPCGPAQADRLADITADAFANDPFNLWVFGGPKGMRATFRTEARHLYTQYGACYTIGDEAGAMWMGPKGRKTLPGHILPGLIMDIARHSGFGAIRRAMQADKIMQQNKPREPYLYLFTIGVRPSAQGRGLGHRLLVPLLRSADEAGLPTYLESSNPANHDFYAGHGFKTKDWLYVRPDAPPLETMIREPNGTRRGKT